MNELDIAYAANDNYASLMGVSLMSLLEHNRNCDNINICVLSDNISSENIKKLRQIASKYHRNICFIDIEASLDIFKKNTAGYACATGDGYTAYAKLAIPDLMPDKKRVIYIDCDTLIMGSIAELMSIDMCGKPIGLAYDCLQNRYKRFIHLNELEGYHNSGVIVFDIPNWNQNKCMGRIVNHISKLHYNYPLPDQDLLNVVLHNDIFTLSIKYNYLSQYYLYSYQGLQKVYGLKNTKFYNETEMVSSKEVVILHFCGQTFIRPWYSNSKHPAKKIYDKYYIKSPWAKQKQSDCKWKLQYKVQYLLWKYAPKSFAVFCGRIMQSVFIRMNYKV